MIIAIINYLQVLIIHLFFRLQLILKWRYELFQNLNCKQENALSNQKQLNKFGHILNPFLILVMFPHFPYWKFVLWFLLKRLWPILFPLRSIKVNLNVINELLLSRLVFSFRTNYKFRQNRLFCLDML